MKRPKAREERNPETEHERRREEKRDVKVVTKMSPTHTASCSSTLDAADLGHLEALVHAHVLPEVVVAAEVLAAPRVRALVR